MKSRNQLLSFSWYCLKHRDQRFWQALRNWSGQLAIVAVDKKVHGKEITTVRDRYEYDGYIDTFYWK